MGLELENDYIFIDTYRMILLPWFIVINYEKK